MTKKLLLAVLLLFSAAYGATAQTLIHYWNFNLFDTEANHLAPTFTAGGANLAYVAGGTSANDFANGTGQNFDIQNLNARNGDVAGNHLRINNPIGASIIFSLPTSGYSDVVIKYATRRSGSGAGSQVIWYSTDGVNYDSLTTIAPNNGDPTLQTFDFSAIAATDNNPNFKLKITFLLGAGGAVGNNRFDNVTLEGTPAGADVLPPAVTFLPITGSTGVTINTTPVITFNEPIRKTDNTTIDNTNVDALVVLKLNNAAGADVPFDAIISGNAITITPLSPLANNQQYYVAVKGNVVEDLSNNAVAAEQSATFTTITQQTVFNPGNLLFVAYQMNAVPNEDRIAFVTFVDILPGTNITFTDSKFTTSQCPGGIVWTAPAAGVQAGTVVIINNDGGTASAGTISGSTFGLSANGDQVIVYTGTNTSPNFITALSSNAWLPGNVSCSGSNSALPAGLTDGVNSINLSTAPGNAAGNTVNAYYSGPMTGSTAALKAAITNPANWTGTASGTPAQTWPTWAFPGAPVVLNARVINANTLQVVFNQDLDPVSATNTNNFTGIPDLSIITYVNNGTLNDTLTLTCSTALVSGTTYTLTVSGVKNSDGVAMAAPFTFTFTYNTTVAFNASILSVSESAGQVNIQVNLTNPSASSVDLVVKGAPFSTANGADFTLSTQTLHFTGSTNSTQTITVPVVDDGNNEQDEYFVLTLENPVGLTITGNQYITVYIRDNERAAPVPNKQVELEYVGSYDPSGSSNASSEIVAYDSASRRLFVISALQNRLDIADFSNPDSVKPITSVDMIPYGGITSVAIKNGIVAVAAPNANQQLNGSVVFFNTDGVFQKQVIVGALPDMITFTPDGKSVLTANEGQPNDSYTVDPEGSVSIIDISGGIASLTQGHVTTLDFTAFNAQAASLIAAGVRKGFPASTLSQDLEPEYITISDDGKTAWIILQEANAFAVLNLQTKTITEIWPLGKKDHNAFGNGFDASDRGTNVHISNWPVKGLYMPDGIANYKVNGTTYLVGANEGDDREYSAFNERLRVNDATYKLDSTIFPNAKFLKDDNNLGRLRVTKASGDTDGDGDFDEIHLIGGRSFSIWNADTKTIVYDSKDDFEQYIAKTSPFSSIFNADHESNAFKGRSTSKGPEPEGLALATLSGKQYAFVSLERQGGVMVYDITDPANVKFVDYKNPRNITAYGGDNGPEGIIFISNSNSPDGKSYILVANEISGTISIYRVTDNLANKPPTISITSPVSGSYPANNAITLTAQAADADGQVVKVEFFNNGVKFAEDLTAPYGFNGAGVEAGSYVLVAKATDNLGAVAVSDTVRITLTACTGEGTIGAEGYINIPGSRITDLTGHPSFPNNPSVFALLSSFEYGNDMGATYGARVRGYICAPQTGDYYFSIASDDQSELWLSTDDNPVNKRKIAYLDFPVLPRVWNRYATQVAKVHLVKGGRYYIEALHKENFGLDHLSVGWMLPNGLIEAPIPGSRLTPWQSAPVTTNQTFQQAMREVMKTEDVKGLIIKASPNPSPNYFTLSTRSNSEKTLTITVTDVLGRIVERKANVAANTTIQIGSGLRPGMYIVEVMQGDQKQKLKLVRQ